MGSEIVTQSEVLDRELEDIFSECLKEGNEKASVEILINSCLKKYANGDLKLKDILLNKLDPDGLNEVISKSEFKTRLTEFIFCSHMIRNEHFLTDGSDVQFQTLDDRPDYWEENDIMNTNSIHLDDSLERLRILKDKNILLENSLVYTDQKIISLENKLGRLQRDSCKKIDYYKAETKRMENLILDLQLQCSELEKKCCKLASDHASAEVKLMQFKILEKKYVETEINFNVVNKDYAEKKSDLNIAEIINKNLERKLDIAYKSKEALTQEITLLKNEISQLINNQAELLIRIESLQHEKQSLILELSELKTSDAIKFVNPELQNMNNGKPALQSTFSFSSRHSFDNVSIKNELAECGYSLSNDRFNLIKNAYSMETCKVFDVNESYLFLNSLNLETSSSKTLKRFPSLPVLSKETKMKDKIGSVSTHSVQTENISNVGSGCSGEMTTLATRNGFGLLCSSFTQTSPPISCKAPSKVKIASLNKDTCKNVNKSKPAKSEEHNTCTSYLNSVYSKDRTSSLKHLTIIRKKLLPRNQKVLLIFAVICTIMVWLYSDGLSELFNTTLQIPLQQI